MNATEIANLALAEIGDLFNISSIDEQTPQAAICKRFYDSTRDAMLRAHPWGFSRHPATLSRLSDAPLFGWDYAYQLPSDYLRLIRFNDLEVQYAEDDYEIVSGKILWTDAGTAQIIYSRKIIDPNLFDALFVEAFALKLAVRISTKLTKDQGLQESLMQRYRAALGEAKRVDANESRSRKSPDYWESELVNARRC